MTESSSTDSALAAYLRPTPFVDSAHPAVDAWAQQVTADATNEVERACSLFIAVRDGLRYDPYTFSLEPEAYRASTVVGQDRAFCVPKAVLLAAGARAVGIPARVGFADVRNHLQSEKLRARMGTDLFVFHGYAELHLGGCWVKATPAFDRRLCAYFGVAPLEFDGTADALFHEFEPDGRRHMEYVRDRGTFVDLPYDEMIAAFRETYGGTDLDPERWTERDDAFHG